MKLTETLERERRRRDLQRRQPVANLDENGEVFINYAGLLPKLQPRARDLFVSLDTNHDGTIAMGELVKALHVRRQNIQAMQYLSVLLLVVCATVFLTTFGAAAWTTTTTADKGSFVPTSTDRADRVVKTAIAEQTVPLGLSPLLKDIQDVRELTIAVVGQLDAAGKSQGCKTEA